MHVIWKRPDGFQNALPDDFRRIALSNGAHLWLHRHELDWYPFQVSGDWEGQDQTKRLNRLVNMLDSPHTSWQSYLEHVSDDDLDIKDNQSIVEVAQSIIAWIGSLERFAKGHTWEIEIVRCALHDVLEILKSFK
ncbi:hypothetical protein [Fluviispira multicolorata]|uniref:Uncharacterized protein n=1 Tax=Fluviispira multicolorata TaxID=2654512 RepID=A0A833JEX4_9BACT|nr:hypothetical protein [Fluviispira multicolorata]KAB8033424.1 hypothetical protein GCL57_01610 [Fluviispira multicolorata]